ncbi:SDR family oxidoreductase [soil metagenome]
MTNEISWLETPVSKLLLPDLRGRTAVVTGSSKGIGQATASLLLENGVSVFGLSHCASDFTHPSFAQIICDLSDTNAIKEGFDKITHRTKHLDYVVNIAGIDPIYSVGEVTPSQWDEITDLNLRAYYFVIKAALPLLRVGQGRSIVNLSSINYRLGVPGRAAYSATKAGILGLTTGLSRELGREMIRINTVSPGWIFTERQKAEYFQGDESLKNLTYLSQRQSLALKITPIDVANHILFYLSEVSRATTGHNHVVDGGWLLE